MTCNDIVVESNEQAIEITMDSGNTPIVIEQVKEEIVIEQVQEVINIEQVQEVIEVEVTGIGERWIGITKIVDNGDWTFTRTYGDWATEITTINLKGAAWEWSAEFKFQIPVWQRDIIHTKPTRPIVTCYDEYNRVILPNEIHYLSSTQLQITRLLDQAGYAVLS